jgi:hypothetical protein
MALDPYAKLPILKDALANTEFEDSVVCLEKVFKESGIKTVDDLDNSTRHLTCTACGCSTLRLIQQIRAYMEGVKEGSIVVEPEPEPEPEVEEVVEEPEVKPAKVSSKSRSSRRAKTKKE